MCLNTSRGASGGVIFAFFKISAISSTCLSVIGGFSISSCDMATCRERYLASALAVSCLSWVCRSSFLASAASFLACASTACVFHESRSRACSSLLFAMASALVFASSRAFLVARSFMVLFREEWTSWTLPVPLPKSVPSTVKSRSHRPPTGVATCNQGPERPPCLRKCPRNFCLWSTQGPQCPPCSRISSRESKSCPSGAV